MKDKMELAKKNRKVKKDKMVKTARTETKMATVLEMVKVKVPEMAPEMVKEPETVKVMVKVPEMAIPVPEKETERVLEVLEVLEVLAAVETTLAAALQARAVPEMDLAHN